MAKFRFRLQSYLNLKQKLEEQQELAYAKALAHLYAEQEARRLLMAERDAEIAHFRAMLHERIDPNAIARYNDYIKLLKIKILERERSIESARIAAEKCRLALVEAMKARKILEKLRERKQEDFAEQVSLEEQKILDEIVSYRYSVAE